MCHLLKAKGDANAPGEGYLPLLILRSFYNDETLRSTQAHHSRYQPCSRVQALLDSEVAELIGPNHQCRRLPAIFDYSDTVSTVLKRLGSRESVEEKLCGIVLRKSAPTSNRAPQQHAPQPSTASAATGSHQCVYIKDVLGFIDLSIILQTALRSVYLLFSAHACSAPG